MIVIPFTFCAECDLCKLHLLWLTCSLSLFSRSGSVFVPLFWFEWPGPEKNSSSHRQQNRTFLGCATLRQTRIVCVLSTTTTTRVHVNIMGSIVATLSSRSLTKPRVSHSFCQWRSRFCHHLCDQWSLRMCLWVRSKTKAPINTPRKWLETFVDIALILAVDVWLRMAWNMFQMNTASCSLSCSSRFTTA